MKPLGNEKGAFQKRFAPHGVVLRVHLGSFGPSMVTKFRDFSMVGPHGGSDSGDLAKIVPGATRVILIPNTENTHFGNDYAC